MHLHLANTLAIANTIAPMIRMKEDVSSNHHSGKLPILDLEVWISENRIYHQFYKKQMASRKVVQAHSAFSTSKKRSILVEEGQRRLKNCSPELDWEQKVVFLNRFSSDMKRSGHTASFRRTIMRRVILKYQTDLANHHEGKKVMFRSRKERIEQNISTNCRKDTWFRSGGATSTLTVPITPGGILAEKVRRNLDKGRQPPGTKTKVIEDGGTSSKAGLVRSNQFALEACQRDDCVLCFQRGGSGQGTKCSRNNVGYQGECTRCEEKYAYIGETSRTGFTRVKEHMDNYRAAAAAKLPAVTADRDGAVRCGKVKCQQNNKCKCDVKSWMWEHTRDCHGGVVGGDWGRTDYRMKVTGTFRKCLYRQIDEDIRI